METTTIRVDHYTQHFNETRLESLTVRTSVALVTAAKPGIGTCRCHDNASWGQCFCDVDWLKAARFVHMSDVMCSCCQVHLCLGNDDGWSLRWQNIWASILISCWCLSLISSINSRTAWIIDGKTNRRRFLGRQSFQSVVFANGNPSCDNGDGSRGAFTEAAQTLGGGGGEASWKNMNL